jgi:uncharacterized membrane protein (GlpM family)
MDLERHAALASAPTSNEIISGVTPSARHHSLLAGYLLNMGRGPAAVRDLIVSDLRGFLDLGVKRRAADLLIVLRFFLAKYPEVAGVPARCLEI